VWKDVLHLAEKNMHGGKLTSWKVLLDSLKLANEDDLVNLLKEQAT